MRTSASVRVYQAMERNGIAPVRVRDFESGPRHADMLRYDLAFCNPEDVSLVIFPVFKSNREGRTSQNITLGRWDSFVMSLQEFTDEVNGPFGKWFTYVHGPKHELVKQTLDEFLTQHPKMQIVSWR